MKKGKKYVEAAKLVDKMTQYEVEDAVSLVKKTAVAKFDETIEELRDVMLISRFVEPLYCHTEQVRLFVYLYLQRVQSLMRHRLQVLISLVERN